MPRLNVDILRCQASPKAPLAELSYLSFLMFMSWEREMVQVQWNTDICKMCLLPSKKHSVVIGGTRPAGTGVTIWLGKTLITEKVLVRKYVYKSCHISSHSTSSTSGGGKSASWHPDNMVGQNSLDCSWFTFTFMINALTAKAAAEKQIWSSIWVRPKLHQRQPTLLYIQKLTQRRLWACSSYFWTSYIWCNGERLQFYFFFDTAAKAAAAFSLFCSFSKSSSKCNSDGGTTSVSSFTAFENTLNQNQCNVISCFWYFETSIILKLFSNSNFANHQKDCFFEEEFWQYCVTFMLRSI